MLEADAALSGIMLPKGVRESKASSHGPGFKSGHLVSANVVAPHHQHFFSFRLDFDVDGPNNSVHEMNTRALPPGPTNPFLNGILMERPFSRLTPCPTEDESAAGADLGGGHPAAQNSPAITPFLLVPGPNSLPYIVQPLRCGTRSFINNHFWARVQADR